MSGAELLATWPALELRVTDWSLSLGPEAGMAWVRQKVSHVTGATESLEAALKDAYDEGAEWGVPVGGRMVVGHVMGDLDFSFETAFSHHFGGFEGWSFELALGLGMRF